MKSKLILIVLPFLVACASNGNEVTNDVVPYHSYDEVIDKVIEWDESFIKEEDKYLVYYFSVTCHYCEEVKNIIIDLALKEIVPIYFCSEGIKTDEYVIPESTIGINKIEDFKIKGFPSLVEFKNHQVSSHFLGRSKVLDYIRSLT